MSDTLSRWILCLIGTAILCSVAQALTPEGAPKRAVKLVCGFAGLLALLSVVKNFEYPDFSAYLAEYRTSAERITEEASQNAYKSTRFIIEEKCAAYILDKATSMGLKTDEVSVTAKWSEDGYWYPVSARIAGSFTEKEKQALSGVIESELGIPVGEQTWSTYDDS